MSTTTSNCPCDVFQPWQVISNTPGLNSIQYRVGDFLTFRHQLLLPLAGEQELINWRPSAKGDLAVQMIEWWAYLADILTFYNERIANQSYLHTADMEVSVKRLIRILGYRPRPGIGAYGTVAALMSNPFPSFTLPQGFPIQSKPGPGKQPQIFEVSAATSVSYPDVVNVDVVTTPASLSSAQSVLLKGVITSIKANDELLLLENQWKGSNNYAVVIVQSSQQEKDPRGNINTRVTFTPQSVPSNLPTDAIAANYRLMKSSLSAHVWQYAAHGIAFTYSTAQVASSNISSTTLTTQVTSRRIIRRPPSGIQLDAITRQIKVGDPILFEDLSGTSTPQLVDVTAYSEVIWYANPKNPTTPTIPPDPDTKIPPIPITHTELSFTPALSGAWNESTTLIRYAWQDVGQLIESPSTTLSGTSTAVTAVLPATFPTPTNGQPLSVMLEDANGNGTSAQGAIDSSSGQLDLTGLHIPASTGPLAAPLRVLFDLLSVTRGKTVPQEILGSGDATVAGQEFVLQNAPLTYLLSSTSTSGGNYTSTLKIMVNNIVWQEVPSFYNQPYNAQVFVTGEDENNMTHVQFGDGINGARLPSGVNNVVATYRYGSGADAPDAGQLTVLTQAWPNLKAMRNPVAVGGGADPDPAKKIRQYAPQSVLTFGRAISADDYETIAAQAPGVARARAYYTWNADQQRSLVTIYVGDTPSAVVAAQTALNGTADPNRPVVVLQATPLPMILHLSLQINPLYNPDAVQAAVTAALLDDDNGLFGINAIRIGEVIYQSQIFAACMGVPGVQAASIINFSRDIRLWFKLGLRERSIEYKPILHSRPFSRHFTCEESIRYSPGEDGFFQLSNDGLTIDTEVS